MWHLLSIITTRLRNNPVYSVVIGHLLFLSICCIRYIPLTMLHLQHRDCRNSVKFINRAVPGVIQGSLTSQVANSSVTTASPPVRVHKKKEKILSHPKKVKKQIAHQAMKKAAKKNEPKKEPAQKKVESKKQVRPEPVKPVKTEEKAVPQLPPQQTIMPPAEVQIGTVLSQTQEATPAEIVHKRIVEIWRPPRNVQPRTSCVIRVSVGKGRVQGKPEVESSSGSSAFDMAARSAVLKIDYPPELWNRVLVIYFS